ncbi:hypothetical protein ACWCPT_19910 [Streptomyces sp. NPDC002308]
MEQVSGRARSGRRQRASEVFALWPSAAAARFADALGVTDRFPGVAFFGQGGGEIGNRKANLRARAAGAGVPILPGRVCRRLAEATEATSALLKAPVSGAVVFQQAHYGAGVGNQLLLRDPELAFDHVGARHLHNLAPGPDGMAAHWAKRWRRWPVVVEEVAPGADAVYSEHYVDAGTWVTETGRLLYVGRRLSHQVVPLDGGTRLAEAYREFGYWGN